MMLKRGVFWLIGDAEDEQFLLIKMFEEGETSGLSKNGINYNHRLLWEHVKPPGCNKPFDYYPRGRVEISPKGKAIIYMNKNIDDKYLGEIIKAFCIADTPKVHYDGSEHYKCFWDREGDH